MGEKMWPFNKSNSSVAKEAIERLGVYIAAHPTICANCERMEAKYLYRRVQKTRPLGGFYTTEEQWKFSDRRTSHTIAYCSVCHAITTLVKHSGELDYTVEKVQHFHEWLAEQKPELVDTTILERGLEKINKARDQILAQLTKQEKIKQLGPYRTAPE